MYKKNKSVTLIELIISVIIISIMILSFYSVDTFSRNQVFSSDKRVKLQNELAYALEHMSKYVQQANGDKNNPPIKVYPDAGPQTGFQVRVDFKSPQTPSDLSNDAWISYSLTNNILNTSCVGTCGSFSSENLSSRVVAGFDNDVNMPVNPTKGFHVSIGDAGSSVDVGLLGRYKPTEAAVSLTNPQVVIKTKIICNSCSAN